MNKVYRVIFNVKKGCYTVVSEIAKRTGKSSSVLKSSTVTAATLAVLITLGGIASIDAANYVNISGTEGSISASASKGMFGGSKEFNFNSEGMSVTGTDYAGSTKKNTTIQDGKVLVSNAAYASEHYTEIDGGSVRTENLKVVPTIKDSLEFKQGGLVVRSEDSRLIVSKNGIDQSVDNGRGQSNSVKVKQTGTVFRTTDNGAIGATETVITGKTITAGDIVINGEKSQSTITGLTNTTVDAKDFGTQGRAATEEQLSAVRKEMKNSGTVINQQFTNIDKRVNTVEKSVKSVDAKVTKVDARVTNVETKVSTIDTSVTNLGKEVKSNTETLTAHTAATNNRFVTVESKTASPDSLGKYSSLDFPLDEYYKLGGVNGHAISVYVNTDEYKWRKIYLSDFTQLGNVEQMYSFIDALELSCLDTGMWVRIGEQSMVVGEDDECCSFVLKEVVKGGKALALYFFDDYAVTTDSRFCFYFNPSIHKDMEIQKRAGAAWNEMKKIFMEYKEKEN